MDLRKLLPVIGSIVGAPFGPTGMAIGSGIGGAARGGLKKGIETGIGSFIGGSLASGLLGGNAQELASAELNKDFMSNLPELLKSMDQKQIAGLIGGGLGAYAPMMEQLPPPRFGRRTSASDNPYRLADNLGEYRRLRRMRAASGGPVRKMQEGGVASLAGISKLNDKELIMVTVGVLKGEPVPQEIASRIISTFITRFGEESLLNLAMKVKDGTMSANAQKSEGLMEANGDGMDDMIPASIEGEQDVLLSNEEFIVPADVVSGIGNGSSDAGATELENMMDRVRKSRTGTTRQAPEIDPREMMPV